MFFLFLLSNFIKWSFYILFYLVYSDKKEVEDILSDELYMKSIQKVN